MIEQIAWRHGLWLNMPTCKVLSVAHMWSAAWPRWLVSSAYTVRQVHRILDLRQRGCLASGRTANGGRARHLGEVRGVLQKASCSVRWKLHEYESVIRSEVVYGLSPAVVAMGQQKRIQAFQMRGLRMLHLDLDRRNTNEVVLRREPEAFCFFTPTRGSSASRTCISVKRLFGHVLRTVLEDPMRQVTILFGRGPRRTQI